MIHLIIRLLQKKYVDDLIITSGGFDPYSTVKLFNTTKSMIASGPVDVSKLYITSGDDPVGDNEAITLKYFKNNSFDPSQTLELTNIDKSLIASGPIDVSKLYITSGDDPVGDNEVITLKYFNDNSFDPSQTLKLTNIDKSLIASGPVDVNKLYITSEGDPVGDNEAITLKYFKDNSFDPSQTLELTNADKSLIASGPVDVSKLYITSEGDPVGDNEVITLKYFKDNSFDSSQTLELTNIDKSLIASGSVDVSKLYITSEDDPVGDNEVITLKYFKDNSFDPSQTLELTNTTKSLITDGPVDVSKLYITSEGDPTENNEVITLKYFKDNSLDPSQTLELTNTTKSLITDGPVDVSKLYIISEDNPTEDNEVITLKYFKDNSFDSSQTLELTNVDKSLIASGPVDVSKLYITSEDDPVGDNEVITLKYFKDNSFDPSQTLELSNVDKSLIASGSVDVSKLYITSEDNPTNDNEAITLKYFKDNSFDPNQTLELSNTTKSLITDGPVDVSRLYITSETDPTEDNEAITLKYFKDNSFDPSQTLELTNTTKSLITNGPVDISGTLSASDMSINNQCNISSTGTITSSTYPLSTINKLNDTPQINKTTINGALISLTSSDTTYKYYNISNEYIYTCVLFNNHLYFGLRNINYIIDYDLNTHSSNNINLPTRYSLVNSCIVNKLIYFIDILSNTIISLNTESSSVTTLTYGTTNNTGATIIIYNNNYIYIGFTNKNYIIKYDILENKTTTIQLDNSVSCTCGIKFNKYCIFGLSNTKQVLIIDNNDNYSYYQLATETNENCISFYYDDISELYLTVGKTYIYKLVSMSNTQEFIKVDIDYPDNIYYTVYNNNIQYSIYSQSKSLIIYNQDNTYDVITYDAQYGNKKCILSKDHKIYLISDNGIIEQNIANVLSNIDSSNMTIQSINTSSIIPTTQSGDPTDIKILLDTNKKISIHDTNVSYTTNIDFYNGILQLNTLNNSLTIQNENNYGTTVLSNESLASSKLTIGQQNDINLTQYKFKSSNIITFTDDYIYYLDVLTDDIINIKIYEYNITTQESKQIFNTITSSNLMYNLNIYNVNDTLILLYRYYLPEIKIYKNNKTTNYTIESFSSIPILISSFIHDNNIYILVTEHIDDSYCSSIIKYDVINNTSSVCINGVETKQLYTSMYYYDNNIYLGGVNNIYKFNMLDSSIDRLNINIKGTFNDIVVTDTHIIVYDYLQKVYICNKNDLINDVIQLDIKLGSYPTLDISHGQFLCHVNNLITYNNGILYISSGDKLYIIKDFVIKYIIDKTNFNLNINMDVINQFINIMPKDNIYTYIYGNYILNYTGPSARNQSNIKQTSDDTSYLYYYIYNYPNEKCYTNISQTEISLLDNISITTDNINMHGTVKILSPLNYQGTTISYSDIQTSNININTLNINGYIIKEYLTFMGEKYLSLSNNDNVIVNINKSNIEFTNSMDIYGNININNLVIPDICTCNNILLSNNTHVKSLSVFDDTNCFYYAPNCYSPINAFNEDLICTTILHNTDTNYMYLFVLYSKSSEFDNYVMVYNSVNNASYILNNKVPDLEDVFGMFYSNDYYIALSGVVLSDLRYIQSNTIVFHSFQFNNTLKLTIDNMVYTKCGAESLSRTFLLSYLEYPTLNSILIIVTLDYYVIKRYTIIDTIKNIECICNHRYINRIYMLLNDNKIYEVEFSDARDTDIIISQNLVVDLSSTGKTFKRIYKFDDVDNIYLTESYYPYSSSSTPTNTIYYYDIENSELKSIDLSTWSCTNCKLEYINDLLYILPMEDNASYATYDGSEVTVHDMPVDTSTNERIKNGVSAAYDIQGTTIFCGIGNNHAVTTTTKEFSDFNISRLTLTKSLDKSLTAKFYTDGTYVYIVNKDNAGCKIEITTGNISTI